jgi:hypothetical protein
LVVGALLGAVPAIYLLATFRVPEILPLEAPNVAVSAPACEGPIAGPGVRLIDANPALPMSDFRAVLMRNGTLEGNLDPVDDATDGGRLFFVDADADRRISGGDRFAFHFRFETTCLPMPSGAWDFRLFWRDEIVVFLDFIR